MLFTSLVIIQSFKFNYFSVIYILENIEYASGRISKLNVYQIFRYNSYSIKLCHSPTATNDSESDDCRFRTNCPYFLYCHRPQPQLYSNFVTPNGWFKMPIVSCRTHLALQQLCKAYQSHTGMHDANSRLYNHCTNCPQIPSETLESSHVFLCNDV